MGDLAFAEFPQFVAGDRIRIRCQLHPGDEFFAVLVFGDAGYCTSSMVGV
ncbi:hypothetical protein [Marinobacter iranensis]